jgi:tetratricopeptide (TPR) repeat protein
MRYHLSICVFILIAMEGQSSARSVEGAADDCAIWGQVVAPGYFPQEPTLIELIGKDSASNQKVRVINGNYRFNFVPPGAYQFRVSDQSGRVIYKETKAIKGTDEHIILSLPQTPSALSGVHTVSIARLKRETPRKARDEFNTAKKAIQNENTDAGLEHLLQALRVDPQYPKARIDLAVLYSRMGRYPESVEQGRMAFEISPETPDIGYSYAMLLITAQSYREAEPVARYMIRNQSYLPQMKAALAVSLIGQRKDFEEALGYLRQAATEFPLARLLAADTLAEIGWGEAAVDQVMTYLNSSANPCERARLEEWIAQQRRPEGKETENAR